MNNYGKSFGFRRTYRYQVESRFRVPADAEWLQGDLVKIDPAASTDLLALAEDGDTLIPGVVGLLIQNERYVTPDDITEGPYVTTRDLSRVKAGQLANIRTGAGVKIWLKNLAADTRSGHKQYDAETRVTLASIVKGSYLKWDGSVYEVGTDETDSIAVVTKVITGVGVEATLLR